MNFGVSGLLFENNLVLFDRATESLWSQMGVQAVCGSLQGTVRSLRPVVQMTWAAWRALYPETTVLGLDTGFGRQLQPVPLRALRCGRQRRICCFPQANIDSRRPLKELALGVVEGGAEKAYPYGVMGERSAHNEVVGGRPIVVVYDAGAELALAFDRRAGGETLSFEIADAEGASPSVSETSRPAASGTSAGWQWTAPWSASTLDPVAAFSAMWFAWASFHPNTSCSPPERPPTAGVPRAPRSARSPRTAGR